MKTMAESKTTLSSTEAAIYDRQMRLWGVEAQKRLQNSHVLIAGMTCLGSELVKNLVLSGMNVTLQDTLHVTSDDVARQFFFDEQDMGQNRVDASVAQVKELNPLVRVETLTKPLMDMPDAFFYNFNVICLIRCSQKLQLRINAICRARKIACFAADSFGMDGILLSDLGDHHVYRRNTKPDEDSPPLTCSFPSLKQSFEVQWSSLQSKRKRGPQIPRVYVQYRLLHEYEHKLGRPIQLADSDRFLAFASEKLQAHGLTSDFFSEERLRQLVLVAHVDVVPVCAIIAGVLGQEIVKAISQRDEPICNCFWFEGASGTGAVRKLA